MKLTPICPESEIYYCPVCERNYTYPDIYLDWKCKICNTNILVKLTVINETYSAIRVGPAELNIGDQVTLENKYIHEILDIQKSQNSIRIALKNYTAIFVDSDSIITKIIGGWN
jgi:hypothetical protein